MRYAYAIAASIGLFIVYAIIGRIMGWKHGGAIPMMLFFAAGVWTWRTITTITGTKGGEK
jgi:hypothetical protein